MKIRLYKLLILLMLVPCALAAQTPDLITLTREGNELSNQKNYAAALEKYRAALAIAPEYAPANYQMAFTLNGSGKGMEALPYLEKVFKSTDASMKLVAGSYNLAGSILDRSGKLRKAITTYADGLKVIKEKPNSTTEQQQLTYNLALVYFRDKQYQQAEINSAGAIFLDSSHASSQRLFALVEFHLNRRAHALLGLCSFVIAEPNTARSVEAYGNIQNIITGGILRPEAGQKPIKLTKETIEINKTITNALKPFATRRYSSAGDLFAAQLKALFEAIHTKHFDPFDCWGDLFNKPYVGYFYKLSQTSHMPAFARFISMHKPESIAWAKAHPQEMQGLTDWIKNTPRWYD